MRTILLLFTIVFIASCGDNQAEEVQPENLIPQEEFSLVMTDIQLMEATFNQKMFKEDEPLKLMAEFYTQIFAKHSISKEDFELSYHWYADHPEQMKQIYEVVITELSKQEEGINSATRDAESTESPFQQLEQSGAAAD